MMENNPNEPGRRYKIVMSEEGYQAFHELADTDKRSLADVIREAMQEYLERRGKQANVSVSRGGYRGGPKEKRSIEE